MARRKALGAVHRRGQRTQQALGGLHLVLAHLLKRGGGVELCAVAADAGLGALQLQRGGGGVCVCVVVVGWGGGVVVVVVGSVLGAGSWRPVHGAASQRPPDAHRNGACQGPNPVTFSDSLPQLEPLPAVSRPPAADPPRPSCPHHDGARVQAGLRVDALLHAVAQRVLGHQILRAGGQRWGGVGALTSGGVRVGKDRLAERAGGGGGGGRWSSTGEGGWRGAAVTLAGSRAGWVTR